MKSIDNLERECAVLRQENIKMKEELKSRRTPDKILDSSKKVCYFTGLPSLKILQAIFRIYFSPHTQFMFHTTSISAVCNGINEAAS